MAALLGWAAAAPRGLLRRLGGQQQQQQQQQTGAWQALLPSPEQEQQMKYDAELKRWLCGTETPEELQEMREEARQRAAGPPPPPPVAAAPAPPATSSSSGVPSYPRYVAPDCFNGCGAPAPAASPAQAPPLPPAGRTSPSGAEHGEHRGGGGADGAAAELEPGANGTDPSPRPPSHAPAPAGGAAPAGTAPGHGTSVGPDSACVDWGAAYAYDAQHLQPCGDSAAAQLPCGDQRCGEQCPPQAGDWAAYTEAAAASWAPDCPAPPPSDTLPAATYVQLGTGVPGDVEGWGSVGKRSGEQCSPPALSEPAPQVGDAAVEGIAVQGGTAPAEVEEGAQTCYPGGWAAADPEHTGISADRSGTPNAERQDTEARLRAELAAARRGWAAAEAELGAARAEAAAWRDEATRLDQDLKRYRTNREAAAEPRGRAVEEVERDLEQMTALYTAAEDALQTAKVEHQDLLRIHQKLERRHSRLQALKDSLVSDLSEIGRKLQLQTPSASPGTAAQHWEAGGTPDGDEARNTWASLAAGSSICLGPGCGAPALYAPPASLQSPKHPKHGSQGCSCVPHKVRRGVG